VVIGLPSPLAKIPNFVIGIVPQERADTSATLPAFQLANGDLFQKGAVNGGTYSFKFIVSQDTTLNSSWLTIVSTALQAVSGIANSIASYGGVLPNLTGITSNYAISQITTLQKMKNNFQPILLLNSFITLGSVSQSNPFLSSQWYINHISAVREMSEGGAEVEVSLQELLVKRDASLTGKNIITNLANEIIGPGVGSSLAAL
jgi:hypothetical protein